MSAYCIFKVRNLPSVPGCFECCPDLIWLRIFGYLDFRTRGRLELVSNGFRRLSLQSWTDVNSIPHAKMLGAEGEKLISPSYFEAILRRSGQFCTRVNLSCVDIAQVELSGTGRFRLRNKLRWLFSLIVANCPRISQISIPNAALIDEDLEFLFCNLKRLESISLHKVVGTPEGPLKGLSFRFCPPLTSLSINVSQICQCLTDEAIRLVADRCSATLNVFELHKHGGDYINDSSLEHLFISCAHLQKVSLQHFGEQLGTQLTGDSLMHIGTSLKVRLIFITYSIDFPRVSPIIIPYFHF